MKLDVFSDFVENLFFRQFRQYVFGSESKFLFFLFGGTGCRLVFFDDASHSWKRKGKAEAAVVWEFMTAEDKAHAMYAVQFEKPCKYRLWAKKWLCERLYDDVDMPEEEGEHLPEAMTNVVKSVPEHRININSRRNELRKELGL